MLYFLLHFTLTSTFRSWLRTRYIRSLLDLRRILRLLLLLHRRQPSLRHMMPTGLFLHKTLSRNVLRRRRRHILFSILFDNRGHSCFRRRLVQLNRNIMLLLPLLQRRRLRLRLPLHAKIKLR